MSSRFLHTVSASFRNDADARVAQRTSTVQYCEVVFRKYGDL